MNSLILREAARLLVAVMLMFSIFMLLRGHNEPGGGFIGGLIAAIAFSLYALASGPQAVRAAMRVDPRALAMVGLGLAVLSGLIALVEPAPFLSGVWTVVGGVKIGTPLLFDLGVFFTVVGSAVTVLLSLSEEA